MDQNQSKPRKFVGRKSVQQQISNNQDIHSKQVALRNDKQPKVFIGQQVPQELLDDQHLNDAIKILPSNYNFEIHKTIYRLRQANSKNAVLQFPEGLLMYSCIISDILERCILLLFSSQYSVNTIQNSITLSKRFTPLESCVILGDVTYGACCVDDFTAKKVGGDFLVHYGHSCLVPINVTGISSLYVFVDISIDSKHLLKSVVANFPQESRIILAGTVQFVATIQGVVGELRQHFKEVLVPQARPLSGGEVLGCTAPVIDQDVDCIVFVADGRFHLEAIMIANPAIPAFRYNPYDQKLTRERYDHVGMQNSRKKKILAAQKAKKWGIVLGTLGRQGNPQIMEQLKQQFTARGLNYIQILLSEVTPPKINQFAEIEAFVQIACPRLSIDWGDEFQKPTLTPYEAMIVLDYAKPFWKEPLNLRQDKLKNQNNLRDTDGNFQSDNYKPDLPEPIQSGRTEQCCQSKQNDQNYKSSQIQEYQQCNISNDLDLKQIDLNNDLNNKSNGEQQLSQYEDNLQQQGICKNSNCQQQIQAQQSQYQNLQNQNLIKENQFEAINKDQVDQNNIPSGGIINEQNLGKDKSSILIQVNQLKINNDYSANQQYLSEIQNQVDLSIGQYPMDYYSQVGGQWSSTYHRKPIKNSAKQQIVK